MGNVFEAKDVCATQPETFFNLEGSAQAASTLQFIIMQNTKRSQTFTFPFKSAA